MKQNTQERKARKTIKPSSLPVKGDQPAARLKATGRLPAKASAAPATLPEKTPERQQREDDVRRLLREASGTKTDKVAERFLTQMANALTWPGLKEKDGVEPGLKAGQVFMEIGPRNAIEAMLSIQMVATNEAALMFLNRSTLPNLTTEAIDANVTRATRLMRLFKDQTEAMAKLKGTAGQQKVTVEHVNVYSGGQAVVGAIAPGGGGGKDGND